MNQKSDKFLNLKYMGYCMSQLPPNEKDLTFEDFVKYAKFKLSIDKCLLMEDPIWEKYTDESLLVEYYATIFERSKEERSKFLGKVVTEGDSDDDFLTWADEMIKKNENEMLEKTNKLEDKISFSPDGIGE